MNLDERLKKSENLNYISVLVETDYESYAFFIRNLGKLEIGSKVKDSSGREYKVIGILSDTRVLALRI